VRISFLIKENFFVIIFLLTSLVKLKNRSQKKIEERERERVLKIFFLIKKTKKKRKKKAFFSESIPIKAISPHRHSCISRRLARRK
jgi:hypothetical protein